MLTTFWLAMIGRSQWLPKVLAFSAFALLLVTLITFFVWIYPVNRATAQWTIATDEFERLRVRWELTNGANAVLTLLALAATVAASLSWRNI